MAVALGGQMDIPVPPQSSTPVPAYCSRASTALCTDRELQTHLGLATSKITVCRSRLSPAFVANAQSCPSLAQCGDGGSSLCSSGDKGIRFLVWFLPCQRVWAVSPQQTILK